MIKAELKFSEMRKLIELCGTNGVAELSVGDFKVVFGNQTKESPITPTAIPTKEAEAQSQVVEMESLQAASRELDQDDLATMAVEDPIRFEQLMIERELEDDGRNGPGLDDHEQSIADEHLRRA